MPKRIAFRFAFAYLVLYHVDAFIGLLAPIFRLVGAPIGPRAVYRMPWNGTATWIAVHAFSIDREVLGPAVNSSTDSAIHYARTGTYILIAIAAAAVWSFVDRHRREYINLHNWLSGFLRYVIAIALFAYGVQKVFPVQMLPGRLFTTYLIQPLGNKSPAGLLWAFVGSSIPYQMFSGAAELLGAVLLLSRRTAALGALVSLAAIVNVVVLNFCFDVDLKLYSANLLIAAVFLAWPVLATLVRLFVFQQTVAPSRVAPSRWTGRRFAVVRVAFAVLIAVQLYQSVASAYGEFKLQSGLPTATPLYGVYEVEGFRRNGVDVPPLTTDQRRWRRMVMESPRVVRVQLMDDSIEQYRAEYNVSAARLTLSGGGPKAEPSGVFEWSVADADHLVLDGRSGKDKLSLSIKRIDRGKFLLMNRGFRWIQQNSLIE